MIIVIIGSVMYLLYFDFRIRGIDEEALRQLIYGTQKTGVSA